MSEIIKKALSNISAKREELKAELTEYYEAQRDMLNEHYADKIGKLCNVENKTGIFLGFKVTPDIGIDCNLRVDLKKPKKDGTTSNIDIGFKLGFLFNNLKIKEVK